MNGPWACETPVSLCSKMCRSWLLRQAAGLRADSVTAVLRLHRAADLCFHAGPHDMSQMVGKCDKGLPTD